jgi:hypothetical protein
MVLWKVDLMDVKMAVMTVETSELLMAENLGEK